MKASLFNRAFAFPVVLAACLATEACESPSAPGAALVVTELTAADLPAPDPSRTWKYRFPGVNADSLTRALLRSGIPLAEAWEPIEDLCADPMGPRYTALLSKADDRMKGLDFEAGSGIRACTRRVRRYVPRN